MELREVTSSECPVCLPVPKSLRLIPLVHHEKDRLACLVKMPLEPGNIVLQAPNADRVFVFDCALALRLEDVEDDELLAMNSFSRDLTGAATENSVSHL